MTRFADEKLQSFYEEFIKHAQEENDYRAADILLREELLKATKENTEAINELRIKSEGAIHLYEDIAAGGRILEFIGKAGTLVLKIAAIGAALFGINHFYGKP